MLEKANVDADYVQVATDIVGTQITLTVPLYARANARYMLRACNEWGCTDSEAVEVTGSLVDAIGYFKASNTGAWDDFGAPVALSGDGDTLAVGAFWEGSNAKGINGAQSNGVFDIQYGAVYTFVRDGQGQWSQQAYIKASNTSSNDWFGWSIALSADANTLAVGASKEQSDATGIGGDQYDNSLMYAGAVYLY